MKRVLKYLKWLIYLGLVIHFTIKDMFYATSLLFYGLPLPILSALALFVSFFSKQSLRRIMWVVTLVCSIIWVVRSYKHHDVDLRTDGLELVFWNARHNKQFQDAFDENKGLPDVLVIVEYDNEQVNDAKNQYPEYYFYLSDKGSIGIFSKTPINILETIIHEDNSVIINFEANGLNLYAVDISASYLNFRKESLRFASSNIHKKKKTIVLGDFNTPFESRHFTFFKDNFVNAFDEKGNGFRETWLWNIPLLSLDHIWVSKDLEIINAEKINTSKSDHSLIKTVIKK